MKLFVYGFWSGFIDKTNSTHIDFFLDLFKLVFNEDIELGTFEESDILLETIFEEKTYLFDKQWKYSFLFSGESRLNKHYQNYSCVLYGERSHDNIINVPLFIPNIYCGNLFDKFRTNITTIPKNNICAIISNPCGNERNYFLHQLDQITRVDYGGHYKNNVPLFVDYHTSDAFIERVAEYKFIVSMENSRGDTYITEKILHGLLAGTIPIYWGSQRVHDYINPKRFIYLNDIHNTREVIQQLINIDKKKYLEMVNEPIFNKKVDINEIANEIKNLFQRKYPLISKIYIINSPEFEPERNVRLKQLFSDLGVHEFNTKYISPTYKQTITDEIMTTHVKYDLMKRISPKGIKKSEISLFLNYKAVLKNIVENYSDGLFLIFESDVYTQPEIHRLNEFIQVMYEKREKWDVIHIGMSDKQDCFKKPYIDTVLPYRDRVTHLPNTYIEDITTPHDKFRLFRKFHTRCTDSFLWNYKGIERFYHHMCNSFYDAPFDYYMTEYIEQNLDFKHYWSLDNFFIQGSNYGMVESTIQSDLC